MILMSIIKIIFYYVKVFLMRKSEKTICIPTNDHDKRFLISKRGENEMLAIGLNPSTANEQNLDPTTKNIEAIAKFNGCDGWCIVNLYPMRMSSPEHLPIKANKTLSIKNIDFIIETLNNSKYNFIKILCCWGNFVSKRTYLKKNLNQLLLYLNNNGYELECIGLTKLGNPYHTSPLTINRLFGGIKNVTLKKFNLKLK